MESNSCGIKKPLNKASHMITGIMHCKTNTKVTGKSSHFFEFTHGILNDAIAVLITSSVAGSVAGVHLAVNIRKAVRSAP